MTGGDKLNEKINKSCEELTYVQTQDVSDCGRRGAPGESLLDRANWTEYIYTHTLQILEWVARN